MKYYIVINKDLKVTPNHPLFINNMWKHAGDVTVGDHLLYTNGEYVQIESIEQVYEQAPTYNFEIESSAGTHGTNTYFTQGALASAKDQLSTLFIKEMQMQGCSSYQQLLTT